MTGVDGIAERGVGSLGVVSSVCPCDVGSLGSEPTVGTFGIAGGRSVTNVGMRPGVTGDRAALRAAHMKDGECTALVKDDRGPGHCIVVPPDDKATRLAASKSELLILEVTVECTVEHLVKRPDPMGSCIVGLAPKNFDGDSVGWPVEVVGRKGSCAGGVHARECYVNTTSVDEGVMFLDATVPTETA